MMQIKKDMVKMEIDQESKLKLFLNRYTDRFVDKKIGW